MIMTSLGASAQVKVSNASNANITVSDVGSTQSVMIPRNNSALVDFLRVENGTVRAKITHSSYKPGKGFMDVDDGEYILIVNNGMVIFSNFRQGQVELPLGSSKRASSINPSSETMSTSSTHIFTVGTVGGGEYVTRSKTYTDQPGITYSAQPSFVQAAQPSVAYVAQPSILYETAPLTTFFVKNSCSKTITGNTFPFTGLCLKAGQTSERPYTVTSGNIHACFSYESNQGNLAAGKNRKWAILDKNIPQGATLLEISDENLVLSNTGVVVRKKFYNTTDRGFLIVNDEFMNGKYQVKSIASNSSQKIDFFLGWNVMSLQYKEDDGQVNQLVLMFLVIEQEGSLLLTEKKENGFSVFHVE